MELKEIMIKKGSRIECRETINIIGQGELFTKNEMYDSPDNNCLTDNKGEDLFITPNYLKYFYL